MRRIHGLTARLILAFVIMTVLTAGMAGIPGVWIIRNALDQQARAHAEDARHATEALIHAEEDRMTDLAQLIGQRPTLLSLLQEPQTSELLDYLQNLRENTGLDLLTVLKPDGTPLQSENSLTVLAPPPGMAAYVWDTEPRQLMLTASAPVVDAEGRPLGMILIGEAFDASFLQQVAGETGAELTITRDGVWVTTSFPTTEYSSANESSADEELSVMWLSSEPYYVNSLPISNDTGPLAILEVAIPVSDLILTQQRALGLVIISTLGIALLSGLLGVFIARSLSHPLEQLTESAHALSEGNLATPVPIPNHPDEIVTLATTLEKSRASISQTMDELSRAKVWAETLIQSIVEGVITIDTTGRIAFFSDGAERILGCQRAEALGQPLESVFRLATENGTEPESLFDHLPARGKRQQVEIVAPGGRPLTLALTGERLSPPESDEVQVALVFRDVTEEEAARNLRAHILANITHEFRTPLAALNASLELLSDNPKVARAGVEELLGSMQLGILNLQTLINNLLESSSIEAGRFDLRLRVTDINVVLADAVRVVQPLLTARGQTLTLSEPIQLPPIQADAARLGQVFINLLSNASKYSPSNTAIDLVLEMQDDSTVKVAIADRGPGILPEERSLLFRRFMRLGQPDDHSQYGIGLGLAVAKTIVESHNGMIGVTERAGGGAEFWFTVKTVQKEEPAV